MTMLSSLSPTRAPPNPSSTRPHSVPLAASRISFDSRLSDATGPSCTTSPSRTTRTWPDPTSAPSLTRHPMMVVGASPRLPLTSKRAATSASPAFAMLFRPGSMPAMCSPTSWMRLYMTRERKSWTPSWSALRSTALPTVCTLNPTTHAPWLAASRTSPSEMAPTSARMTLMGTGDTAERLASISTSASLVPATSALTMTGIDSGSPISMMPSANARLFSAAASSSARAASLASSSSRMEMRRARYRGL
mmetsp:Transcript_1208/g.4771  ORF Transcript_1208/g.4771 Transcript_1208/m.4771 type:complete len:249 (-) Transcript_1208:1816-2562(-)